MPEIQREIPVHGEVRKLKDAPMELLKLCDDELGAIHLCIQLSPFTHDYIGKKLGIDKGHFSRMMSGTAGFPTQKRIQLMELCGNRAPVQYEVMQIGAGERNELAADLKTENEALKAKLAALEGALAAMLTPRRAA